MSKTKLGKMPCESCGEIVVVRKNERGTLSYRCDECDAAPYARTDTGLHKIWMGKLQPITAKPEETGMQQGAETDLKPAANTPAPAKNTKSDNIWGL